MKKTITLILVSILIVSAGIGVTAYLISRGETTARPDGKFLHSFDSPGALVKAFKNGIEASYGRMEDGMAMKSLSQAAAPSGDSTGTSEHSTTNVQVEGVDEADVVKNDGKYIYTISGRSIVIVAAYPPGEARVLSKIDSGSDANPSELFIEGDTLVAIGTGGYSPEPRKSDDVAYPRGETSFIKVYDVGDREEPRLLRTIEYEGSYNTSRMIGRDVHVVLGTYPYYALYEKKNIEPSDIIPRYREYPDGGDGASFAPVCDYRDIEAVDPERFSSFLSVVSFSLDGGGESVGKRVIAGGSENVYASAENLYVTSSSYQYYDLWTRPEDFEEERTTVHKFKFDGPSTSYVKSVEVPGTILNQFSMDEFDGNFRIATTRGHVSREGSDSDNNVYVLGPDMEMAGRLEGLAPGEKIYSARFMGKRAYLVTFKKVDPLFVLDLSDPGEPRVLGELKIPGYSDYLHPYDETHIIGVGKNAVEADPEEGGNFAWYQGMKIAIFDVSDFAHPREMHKVEIGDRGTDSYALYDHKAFLFDRDKNLLVVPVALCELTPEQKASPDTKAYDYGDCTFQGAYVYDLSLAGGFYLKGRITHVDDPGVLKDYYGYYGSPDAVRRSLYIGDDLYTVSDAKIKVNSLLNLADVATVKL